MSGKLHAWGDESARLRAVRPSYLLGAAVADLEACAGHRDVLRRLLRAGPKLHWRDLDRREKFRVIEVVGKLELVHIIVVASPVTPRGQERARALCLERLAWELHEEGVAELTLEARPLTLMKRDIRTIDALRGKKALPQGLRVGHGLPSTEPMLWIADQVLGALGDSVGGDSRWFDAFKDATRIVEVDV